MYLGILPTVRYCFIYAIVTDMGGQYQDIQTTQGSWYGPVEMILPEPEAREISCPLVRTISQEQSVYPDCGLHISNYCVY